MTLKLSGVQLGVLTGGPSSINLYDLADVSIVSPQTGQYLRYNAGISEWQNAFIDSDLAGSEGVTINRSGPTTTIGLGAITPTSVAATGTVTGSNISGTNTGDQTITLTGDVTGTGTGSFSTTLATVNISPQSDTFRKITVNGKGLITATSAVSSSDITTVLGYTPVDLAGDTMSGYLVLNADPNTGLGAATKQYVDNIASGLTIHAACVAGTTGDLSATYNNGVSGVGATLTGTGALPAIDGVTLSVNDRLLVKDQSSALENGIYVVTQITANWVLTRAADFDGAPASEIQAGDAVFIQQGTTQDNTQWVQNTDSPITVGTTAIVFVQFGGPGTYTAGTGIDVTGTVISNIGVLSNIAGTGIGVSNATGNVTISNIGVTSLSGTAGNITTSGSTGAITLDLDTAGSPISDQFVKITTDAYGRVTASSAVTTGDITPLVNTTYVKIAGDTMTGDLVISKSTPIITLDEPASNDSGIYWSRSTVIRWYLLNYGTEGGSNTGSDIGFFSYDDNGTYLDTPLTLNRADSSATFTGIISAPTILASSTGSASAPSFSLSGNTDTGIYSSGTNILNVTTGGTLAATFGSSGEFTTAGTITSGANIISTAALTVLSGYMNLYPYNGSYDDGGYVRWFWDGNNGRLNFSRNGGSGTSGATITATGFNAGPGSAAIPAIAVRDDDTGIYSSGTSILNVTTGGTLAATFASNGDFTAVGDVTAYSDARLKTNIELIPDALSKVLQLRGVVFDRIDNGEKGTGVIAQEVEIILPEVVKEMEDGTKTVAYGNMVGLLIESIKELNNQINALQVEIKALKG